MQITQLVNGYSKGDGVGNVITAIDGILKKLGYETTIHNQTLTFADAELPDFQEDNILLYHVALSVDPVVSYLKCHKILVFHNITDPELLDAPGLSQMRTECAAGLYEVSQIVDYYEAAIVFSDYSKQTLINLGWDVNKIFVIPIMVRFDNLSMDYNHELVAKYRDGNTNILFTGRIFPNKKQEDIIASFYEYKRNYNNKSRLFLVGGVGNQGYQNALEKMVNRLNIDDCVVFTGKAPFSDYLAYYHLADVYLCMSSHEGFCIPLLEAMYFDLPIIAVDSTAVTSTLGGSGILTKNRNPSEIAAIINKVVKDSAYSKSITDGEKDRLTKLLPDALLPQYSNLLQQCIELCNNNYCKPFPINRLDFSQVYYPASLVENNQDLVVYGMGAMGHKLVSALRAGKVDITCVCDANKAGNTENGIKIILPEEAFKRYQTAKFVISVQNKHKVKEILKLMIESGINISNIYIYESKLDEIM